MKGRFWQALVCVYKDCLSGPTTIFHSFPNSHKHSDHNIRSSTDASIAKLGLKLSSHCALAMSDLEEDPYISDGDSDEETINQALNNQTYTNAHDEALTPRNVDLPFDLDYVPHWTEQDVFRELYQNM